jgi:predicted phosphate transport protein (TIGR00153 family)
MTDGAMRDWILPQEERFFAMLEKHVGVVREGAEELHALLTEFDELEERRGRIKDIEHRGDEIVHAIHAALNESFVTPIDKEDISGLASRLDDVLDYMFAAANRLVMYEVEAPTPSMRKLADIIRESVGYIEEGVAILRHLREGGDVRTCSINVNRLENEADELMNQAVAALLRESDAVTIIKLKEIYEKLELVTDLCEDVADILEDIVAKNR